MQSQSPTCSLHSLPYTYICAANQWHFVPLCATCVIDHSKLHTKSKHSMILVSIDEVFRKSGSMKEEFQGKFKERMTRIQELRRGDWMNHVIDKLEVWRVEMIRHIDKIIDGIRDGIKQRGIGKIAEYQSQLEIANGIMLSQAQRLQKITSSVKSIDDFDAIKLIYFKDDTEMYFQQIDEAIKDYQTAAQSVKLTGVNLNSILNKIDQVITQQISNTTEDQQTPAENIISQQFQKEKVVCNLKNPSQKPKDSKMPVKTSKAATKITYPKLVSKPKICQDCGSQLQYLTSLKKHLVCKSCGSNARNYTKKFNN